MPVFVRGTNLTTGRDLSCDGVPLKEIYDSDAIQAPPVNSPWAPLNYDFGSEMIGWMSHAAGFPADDFTFQLLRAVVSDQTVARQLRRRTLRYLHAVGGFTPAEKRPHRHAEPDQSGYSG